MLGFHAVSAAPISTGRAKSTHHAIASLSATATQELVFSRLGAANLSMGGSPYTLGFDSGFDQGSSFVATASIVQEFLGAVATLIADGSVDKLGSALLATSGTLNAHVTALGASLQSIGSLTGNSVLLHRATVNLSTLASLQAELKYLFEDTDQVNITLYLDRIREISTYIDTIRSLTSHIDKERATTLYMDKILSPSSYIDQQKSFDLVREK